MNFTYNINIPSATPEDNPLVYEMKLAYGWIYNMKILSSVGTNYEVYCKITDTYDNPVYPKNPGSVYQLYGQPIIGKFPSCKYELTGTDMSLLFKGWSPNATHDHIITVSFWIVREEDIPYLMNATKTEISGLLGGLKNE